MRSLDYFQIKNLIRLYNYLYRRISYLSSKINHGVHPKHRIMNYHEYFLNNIKVGSKVLDIGCGHGELDYDLASKAKYVIAIDIDKESIRIARDKFQRRNIKYIIGDATIYDFKEKFDYVVLSNVLEHLKSRVAFLKKIKPLTNKFLIRVPMLNRSWLSIYKKELGLEYRLDKSHTIEYTLESFEKELKLAGLRILSHSIQFGEIWATVISE